MQASAGRRLIPKLLRFDPATGTFTDTGVDLHFTSQFRTNVGDLIAVIPLGCIAPNAAGTGDSYFFACVVSNNTIPGNLVIYRVRRRDRRARGRLLVL